MPDKSFLIYKVTPKDIENLAATEKEIRGIKSGIVKDIKREPIGFGIEILKAGILVDAKDENAVYRVTKELESLDSVEEVDQESMTLL